MDIIKSAFVIGELSSKSCSSTTHLHIINLEKQPTSQKLSAYLLSATARYSFSKKIHRCCRYNGYTSGGTNGSTSKSFDPLYGTPHKFWGLMDYFYAASPFDKNGLTDYYIKTRYKASDKILLTADVHQFTSAAKIANNDKKSLGQELDIVGNLALQNKYLSKEDLVIFSLRPFSLRPM